MAKKKKPEEPENLERWLVSYSDFMTLLFATFVVLYALAQTDAKDLQNIEDALKQAFSQNTLFEGQQSVMDGSDSIFDQQQANSFIPPLMSEYISQKYETDSFTEIEEEVKELADMGELKGISTRMTEKGLLLTFDNDYLFASGSAQLNSEARNLLDKVGVLICKKFILHKMYIEGHTDSSAISSLRYPSNWELSSARACSVVRYLISRFGFMPNLFTAVGLSDTVPAKNTVSSSDAKNRRVEILIIKNKYNDLFSDTKPLALSLTKSQQEEIQKRRGEIIKQVEGDALSPAVKNLLEENRRKKQRLKSERLSKKNMELYVNIDDTENNAKEKDVLPKIEKRVIKLNSNSPTDEDFGL